MREWTADHPKAALMQRKQRDILVAARRLFLEKGFGTTTMTDVAEAASVSIATLYRHVQNKEDLFRGVVRLRRDQSELEAGLAQLRRMSLDGALLAFGRGVLGVMLEPDVLALQRLVIAEGLRFPELGPVAWEAVFGIIVETLSAFLTDRTGQPVGLDIAEDFAAAAIGDRPMRALMGLTPIIDEEREVERIRLLARNTLAQLATSAGEL